MRQTKGGARDPLARGRQILRIEGRNLGASLATCALIALLAAAILFPPPTLLRSLVAIGLPGANGEKVAMGDANGHASSPGLAEEVASLPVSYVAESQLSSDPLGDGNEGTTLRTRTEPRDPALDTGNGPDGVTPSTDAAVFAPAADADQVNGGDAEPKQPAAAVPEEDVEVERPDAVVIDEAAAAEEESAPEPEPAPPVPPPTPPADPPAANSAPPSGADGDDPGEGEESLSMEPAAASDPAPSEQPPAEESQVENHPPAEEQPPAEEPALDEQPTAEGDESPAEEEAPADEQPPADEPPAEEPAAEGDQPAEEQVPADEPAADEQPPAEKPPAAEPPAEELPADGEPDAGPPGGGDGHDWSWWHWFLDWLARHGHHP